MEALRTVLAIGGIWAFIATAVVFGVWVGKR